MRIYDHATADIVRYMETHRRDTLEQYEPAFENYLRLIRQGRSVDGSTRMLEIGTGTGWFPILCRTRGLQCRGLEISPPLIAFAQDFGRRYGVAPDIALGNLEESSLGREQYDVIVASSVFEHVEHWRRGLEKIYDALAPGGALFFESTNKFSFTSGEYGFPLYGWLPNAWRYRLRIALQGPDIMRLGIDFHQFTYFGLRRVFRQLGFAVVKDRVDLASLDRLHGIKRLLVSAARRFPPLRHLLLLFAETTTFVCVKKG